MTPEEILKMQQENANLKNQNADLTNNLQLAYDANNDLKDQLQTATEVVKEQSEEIERLKNGEKQAKPIVTVKLNKKDVTYVVNHAVRKGGKIYSAQEISENPKLAKELAEGGSDALTEVKEPELTED